MHKEGLEIYNNLIKLCILIIFTSIRKDKEILLDTITCISPCSHNNLHDQLNYNFH